MLRTACLVVVGSLWLVAPVARAAPTTLTARQAREIRKDVHSLMGYHVRLYSGRNPRIRTSIQPAEHSAARFNVTAEMVARWHGQRGVQETREGVVEVRPDGQWVWVKPKPGTYGYSRALHADANPAHNIGYRESIWTKPRVIRREPGKAWVIYNTEGYNELRIAVVDTDTRRPISISGNLAQKPLAVARKAFEKSGGRNPSNVVLGDLTKSGRAVKVEVYSNVNGFTNWPADRVTTYAVALDTQGRPTGRTTVVGSRSF
jgi:hypothetical protein